MLWVLGGVAMAAQPWPAHDEWLPLERGGAALTDAAGDHAGVGDASADLLGASWDATADALFLRLELGADPTGVAQDWGFLVDTDGATGDFEVAILVQGSARRLVLWAPPAKASGVWVAGLEPVDVLGYGSAATGEVRVASEGGAWFVDLQLPRPVLDDDLGITASTVLRFAGVSAVTWVFDWEDVLGCGTASAPCDDLGSAWADVVQIDGDGDLATDPQELRLALDRADRDTDDDGAWDGEELGRSDPTVCDTDGDGLADGLELGRFGADADTRRRAGCYRWDADRGATVTDPAVADTDGGGLLDGEEDHSGNGRVDDWETDPLDPGDDLDSDGDRVPDVFDEQFGAGPDEDSDGDGLLDVEERFADTDGDGTPDFADLDSDNDGLPDGVDGLEDPDGDGLPAFRDVDADDDGLPDGEEGAPHHVVADRDADGLEDGFEGFGDTDGDGLPDLEDPDSDGDGIPDLEEGRRDTDNDGIRDFRDLDSDNDGVPDEVEGLTQTDNDGIPDYRDFDSDNDGRFDVDEAGRDDDCDGLDDRVDRNLEDGFCDSGLVPPSVADVPLPPFRPALPEEPGGCASSPSVPPAVAILWAALVLRRRRE